MYSMNYLYYYINAEITTYICIYATIFLFPHSIYRTPLNARTHTNTAMPAKTEKKNSIRNKYLVYSYHFYANLCHFMQNV